jgi:hypothetical protein
MFLDELETIGGRNLEPWSPSLARIAWSAATWTPGVRGLENHVGTRGDWIAWARSNAPRMSKVESIMARYCDETSAPAAYLLGIDDSVTRVHVTPAGRVIVSKPVKGAGPYLGALLDGYSQGGPFRAFLKAWRKTGLTSPAWACVQGRRDERRAHIRAALENWNRIAAYCEANAGTQRAGRLPDTLDLLHP